MEPYFLNEMGGENNEKIHSKINDGYGGFINGV